MPYVRSYRMRPGGAQLLGRHRHPIQLAPGGGFTIAESNPAADIHTIESYVQEVRGMGQTDTVDLGGGDTLQIPDVSVGSSLPVDTSVDTSGGGFDWSALANALTKGAQSGVQVYRSLTPPSLVPGTNAIFNPATGQFYNPLTGQVVSPPGVQPTTNIPLAGLTSSPLLIGGVILGGVLLAVVAMRKN